MRRTTWVWASAAGILLLASRPAVLAQREIRERSILVSVTTDNDTPVADMGVADFVVRENGVAREVIRVSPAPPPTHVLLLLDDSQATQPAFQFLRTAVPVFITAMVGATPAPHWGLMTFGDRPIRRVDYSPNPDAVRDAVGRIFPVSGAGAYLLQGIVEACADLRKRAAPAPVIVAFVAESGPEYSNDTRTSVAAALRAAGASLWVVTLQEGGQSIATPEARERAVVLGDITKESGGMNKVVLSPQSLDAAFATVATLLNARVLVTYGRPDALVPPDRIDVESRRRDVTVRSSKWAGR